MQIKKLSDYIGGVKVYKNAQGVAGVVDQTIVSAGNFLTLAIGAQILPILEQGKFVYIFASYMGLLIVNVAGIFQAAAVRAPLQDAFFYNLALARLQLFQAILMSLFICFAWFLCGDIFDWTPTLSELILLFSYLFLQQSADFDRRSAYIFKTAGRALFSSALLYPVRVIALLLIKPMTVDGVLILLIISAFIPASLTIFLAAYSRMSFLSWTRIIKEHFLFSKLFILGAPLGWLVAYLPIFLLGIIDGKASAAMLASIRGITNIANILMEQIETKVVADWGRIRHAGGLFAFHSAVTNLKFIGFVFWFSGMIIFASFGQPIVRFLLGESYMPDWKILIIAWIGYGLYFGARLHGIRHRTLGLNQIEFFGNFLGVFVSIFSGVILIKLWGVYGASWVYVLVGFVMWVSQTYYTKRLGL